MAFIGSTEPFGIRMSHSKVKDLGNKKIELTESDVDRDGKEKTARHEIMKNNDGVEWLFLNKMILQKAGKKLSSKISIDLSKIRRKNA